MTEENLKLKCVTGGKLHRLQKTPRCPFFNTKIFLEFFKVIAGSFYLDFDNKELKNEFLNILESFPSRAGRFNSSFKKDINKMIKYVKGNYFGHRARFPSKYWNISIVCRHLPKSKLSKLNHRYV